MATQERSRCVGHVDLEGPLLQPISNMALERRELQIQNLLERGHTLAHETPVVPKPCIHLTDLGQRKFVNRALAVGGPIESAVMNGDKLPVPGQVQVRLDEPRAEFDGTLDLQLSADPQKLRQTLDNLVANALKFTPRGGRVRIRVWREDERTVLEIADTGPGIPPAERDTIFDRYKQGSRGRASGGAGLGLAIARGIVEAHHGTISVADGDMGGTMRLGAYQATLTQGSRVAEVYGTTEISERHRHRYEVNTNYASQLAQHGMMVSGWSPDGRLPEIMEIPSHPWFIGVQFHPELKSRPLEPHPLFTSFIAAAVRKSRLV